jgi:hypothetical protein
MRRVNITVPEDLWVAFKKYCEEECRPLSAQLQFMMRQTLLQVEVEKKQKSKSLYNQKRDDVPPSGRIN